MTAAEPVAADILHKIEQARHDATAAVLEAEAAEGEARRKRRHAKSLLNRYDKLVQEHMGQLAAFSEESLGQPSST